MKLRLFQIDAFTDKLFGGNPAAVIPLKKWLSTSTMQKIALENNLSETVFFVPSTKKNIDYDIRWFTPAVEINLCGHATLASAYVLFKILKKKKNKIVFNCKSGLLTVTRNKSFIELDFPSWKPELISEPPANLSAALGGVEIVATYRHRDLLVELMNEDAVRNCSPEFTALKAIGENIIITAPGKKTDFVSRFFGPSVGIDEDPITGSAHSQLIPFWYDKTGKEEMTAKQLSSRGGELICRQLNAQRVSMAGQCVFYMEGFIRI